jgi:hypothetical protein
VHTYFNPSTREAEAGRSRVPYQPARIYSEILSQKQTNKKTETKQQQQKGR